MSLHLYIGNRRLSSWSLRAYLALVHSKLPFETTTIMLDTPQFRAEVAQVSPTLHVPVVALRQYIATIFALPGMRQWIDDAQSEPTT